MTGRIAKRIDAERVGSRVAVRLFGGSDLSEVGPWYEGRRLEESRSDPNVTLLAVTNREDDAPIGVVGYCVGSPEGGWLSFDSVAVEPGLRGLGLESEAVRLVEGEMAEKGRADRFCARVDKSNGLELYFWLRLGYRPARPGEDPWPGERPNGIMSMVRWGRLPGGRGGS